MVYVDSPTCLDWREEHMGFGGRNRLFQLRSTVDTCGVAAQKQGMCAVTCICQLGFLYDYLENLMYIYIWRDLTNMVPNFD